MKRIATTVFASIIFFLCFITNAFCLTLRWDFTGTISSIDIPLETLSVGDAFTGFFGYSYSEVPTNQTPGSGMPTYTPDDNLFIEYGIYFDGFSTAGVAAWMWMSDLSFPATPNTVWGLNPFQGNSELSYIEDCILNPGGFSVLAGVSSTPLFHIHGQFNSFTCNTQPVSEPATMILLGTGFLGLIGFHKRKRQN